MSSAWLIACRGSGSGRWRPPSARERYRYAWPDSSRWEIAAGAGVLVRVDGTPVLELCGAHPHEVVSGDGETGPGGEISEAFERCPVVHSIVFVPVGNGASGDDGAFVVHRSVRASSCWPTPWRGGSGASWRAIHWLSRPSTEFMSQPSGNARARLGQPTDANAEARVSPASRPALSPSKASRTWRPAARLATSRATRSST